MKAKILERFEGWQLRETKDIDTPYMVQSPTGATATLSCAIGEAEVEGEEIPDAFLTILRSWADKLGY